MNKDLRTLCCLGIVILLGGSMVASSEEPSGGAAAGGTVTSEAPAAGPPGNLVDALAGTSGVRVATMCTNCNVASVTMLGQGDDRVQVWQDGLPVQGGLGAIYLLSVMPSSGIARTEIVRGTGSVLSGAEASAGAVLLQTRVPEKKPYLFASLDAGSLDWASQKLLASGRRGRWGGTIAYTHSRSAGSDPNGDGNFDLGAFGRTTVGGTLSCAVTKRTSLRLDAVDYREGQRDNKGGYTFLEPTRFFKEDVDIHRREIGLTWDLVFPDRSRITVRGRYARRDQDTSDNFPGEQNPYMQVDEFTRIFESRYEATLFGRHRFTAGVDAKTFEVRGQTVKSSVLFPDGQKVDDFIRRKGAFAETDLSLPARLDLTLGLRYDDFDWTPALPPFGGSILPSPLDTEIPKMNRTRVSPRARLGWKATSKLALSLSAGTGFSVPRPVFERTCCGALVLSNAFSPAETSKNYLLDADYVPWRWFKIRASLFRSDFTDFLQKMAVLASPDYVPSFAEVNYGEFALEGAELSMEMRFLERLSYGFEATHLRVKSDGPLRVKDLGPLTIRITLPASMIPFIAKDQGSAFVRWDDPVHGIHASVQAQYTGPIFVQVLPATGFVSAFDRTPSFWVLNLRGEARIRGGLSAFAGVDNVTNQFQSRLGDPRYEYNWGPLRGRYVYGGLSFEM